MESLYISYIPVRNYHPDISTVYVLESEPGTDHSEPKVLSIMLRGRFKMVC